MLTTTNRSPTLSLLFHSESDISFEADPNRIVSDHINMSAANLIAEKNRKALITFADRTFQSLYASAFAFPS